LPSQDHVYITTNELFRFHENEVDEMPCKLDSTENLRSFLKYQPHLTPVAGHIFSLEKVSDSPNFFSEFFFPNSVLLCSFLGLWSGFINSPLQSLVNQHFSQAFERLFSKKKQ